MISSRLRRVRHRVIPFRGLRVDMPTAMPDDHLIAVEKHFDSIYYNQSTYNAALLAAGSAIETTLAVVEGNDVKNAIAVIRPPGHHAECDRSMGFCHFDNVAVAVKVTRARMPSVRKIFILDW